MRARFAPETTEIRMSTVLHESQDSFVNINFVFSPFSVYLIDCLVAMMSSDVNVPTSSHQVLYKNNSKFSVI